MDPEYDDIKGESVLTDEGRFTKYHGMVRNMDKKVLAEELYDHHKDLRETVNVVQDEKYFDLRNRMAAKLKKN